MASGTLPLKGGAMWRWICRCTAQLHLELRRRQPFDGGGGKQHVFDAEAGVDLGEALGEEAAEMVGIAARPRRADGYWRRPAVDAIAAEREPARAEHLVAQRPAQHRQQ